MRTWQAGDVRLYQGDCLDVLAGMAENSVDSVITDPPYGLSQEPDIAEVLGHWLAGDTYEHNSHGFMQKKWDSFVPGPEYWRACYRVLKPGGYLLAFASTRTWDLLSMAIRFAGFENRDTIASLGGPPALLWNFGSGFPKAANVSKMLDKAAGAERETVGRIAGYCEGRQRSWGFSPDQGWNQNENGKDTGTFVTAPATPEAQVWEGWASSLKPAWECILMFRKPMGCSLAANALKWGVAGLWIDGARIPTNGDDPNQRRSTGGYNSGVSEAIVPNAPYNHTRDATLTMGRWPANVILSHSPGCVRVGTKRVKGQWSMSGKTQGGGWYTPDTPTEVQKYGDPDGYETVDDYVCDESCPIRLLDEQAGISKSSGGGGANHAGAGGKGIYGTYNRRDLPQNVGIGDTGSASRFYTVLPGDETRFLYCSKASRREREAGLKGCDTKSIRIVNNQNCKACTKCGKHWPNSAISCSCGGELQIEEVVNSPRGNIHPCCKPLALMQWLCRLTKTPGGGGVVLDPFMGSGSTGIAAIREGRQFIGIEKEPEYFQIAKRRIEHAQRQMRMPLEAA